MRAGRTWLVVLSVAAALGGLPRPARADAGPQRTWIVLALPNQEITPDWRSYAPAECRASPDQCAEDHRFWDLWDFSIFADAIDGAFSRIAGEGNYYGMIPILPLGDTDTYWNNIRLMYDYAAAYGLAFDPAVFPKWKFGAEYCYLYSTGAPGTCRTISGTTTAVAYDKMLGLMGFVQNVGGGCPADSWSHQFAIWYGWSDYSPGFDVVHQFWHSLPDMPCNHQGAYVTWLDTPYALTPAIQQLQSHVIDDHGLPFRVVTELYSQSQLTAGATVYAPYQIVVTGYYGAADPAAWSSGMCQKWTWASQPPWLGVWTYFDRDVPPLERYRALIDGDLADVTSLCPASVPRK